MSDPTVAADGHQTDEGFPDMHASLTRRDVLGRAAIAAGGVAVGVVTPSFAPALQAAGHEPGFDPRVCGDAMSWDDPAAWPGGKVPGPGDVAVVSRDIVVSGARQVAGVQVKTGATLSWDPIAGAELRSTGNVVVDGTLRMRPSAATVDHALVFVGVDESAFVGGGMEVLDSDVGLWVVGEGRLDLQGHERTGWSRAADALPVGARGTALEVPVSGWVAGDEVAVVPTAATNSRWHLAYDDVRIESVSADRVAFTSPMVADHPLVRGQWGAELLNLSRNVRLEGTASGRAHIMFLHVVNPQEVRHVAVRHMGPRPSPTADDGHLGRYPVHFHHCGDGVRGSLLEGVVVRDSGNRAFVVHESNGVTLQDCIAHGVVDDAYWWDSPDGTRDWTPPASDDITYRRCVASAVRAANRGSGNRMGGFSLGAGVGNRCLESVAVGVDARRQASGFAWPSMSIKVKGNTWEFSGCRSHNNGQNGLFVWQNDPEDHVLELFEVFHNGTFGMDLGAYGNNYQLADGIFFANGSAGMKFHAKSSGKQSVRNVVFDGGGVSTWGVSTTTHRTEKSAQTVVEGCVFTGHRKAAVAMHPEAAAAVMEPDNYLLLNCSIDGNELWFGDAVHDGSVVVLRDASRDVTVRPASHPSGRLVRAWNAKVVSG